MSQTIILSTKYQPKAQKQQGLESCQDFYAKTKTNLRPRLLLPRPRPRLSCVSRPRPRPRLYFLSSRRLETKTLVSRTTSLLPSYYNATKARGNIYKLLNHSFHSNLQKFYFTARVVNIWNSLPDYVVAVDCVNTFKTRLLVQC